MAYINYAPMRIGTADPWALTELAKAVGPGGAQPSSPPPPPPQPRGGLEGTPHLGNLPLRALVCDEGMANYQTYTSCTCALIKALRAHNC